MTSINALPEHTTERSYVNSLLIEKGKNGLMESKRAK